MNNFQIGDRVRERNDERRIGTVIALTTRGVQVVFDARRGEVPKKEILRSHELAKAK